MSNTFIDHLHPEALAAAQAALLGTGTFTTTAGYGASSAYIFKDEANNWRSAPCLPGFEGQAPRNFDGVDYAEIIAADLRRAAEMHREKEQGRTVTQAISAIHNTHKSDGRPTRYIPEGE